MTGLAALDALVPVALEELVERAALLTRVDRKYVVPGCAAEALVRDLAEHAQVLEIDGARSFGYASTYLDTPDLAAFHRAAQRRRRRFKVRTRTYLSSGESYLEVKTRGPRGSTVKQRAALPGAGDGFLDEALARAGVHGVPTAALLPVLETRYLRSTLLLPTTESRVTLDSALSWQLPDGAGLHLDDVVVVETKSGAAPSEADRLLWSAGLRPARLSKYGTGLAALRPDLPAHRWRRVLDRHFRSAHRLPVDPRPGSRGTAVGRAAAA